MDHGSVVMGKKSGEDEGRIEYREELAAELEPKALEISLEEDIGLVVPKSGKLTGKRKATDEVRAGGLAPSFQ
jgi:hypothetical protein